MENRELGLIDNWLRNIKDTYQHNYAKLAAIPDENKKLNLLCELNVKIQVANVCHTTIVQNAWNRGQELNVHGWIYSIQDGLLHDLDVRINDQNQTPPVYRVSED